MKIWLNTTPEKPVGPGECESDCEWECINHDHHPYRIDLPLVEEDLRQIRTFNFLQATPLHAQECIQDRWLICNPTGSGQLAVLDSQAYSLFERFRTPRSLLEVASTITDAPSQSIEGLIALLYKAGLLQEANKPFPVYEEEKVGSLSAWLHVTNACNLRCHYCYLAKSSEEMAEDTALRAIDAIFRSAIRHDFKKVKLKYAGGEASLHMANVIAIHDYAAQLAQRHHITLRASLLSNGVVLSQRAIDQLKARHIGVMISLDGIGKYHDSQRPFVHGQGSFRYVNRTIDRLLANALVPSISVTVSQRNLDGLPGLLEYILERDLPFTFNYYRENEYASNSCDLRFSEQQMISAMRLAFKTIEHHLPKRCLLSSLIDKSDLQNSHRRTCGVGQSYLVIDQHGKIAKCQADIKHKVATIYDNDPLQLIRDDRKGVQGLSVTEKEGCRTCDWRYWCTGGCPHLTHRMTGRYDVKSPNCNIYTTLFPEALRLEALRLLKYVAPIMP